MRLLTALTRPLEFSRSNQHSLVRAAVLARRVTGMLAGQLEPKGEIRKDTRKNILNKYLRICRLTA